MDKLDSIFGKNEEVVVGMLHIYPSKEQIENILGREITDDELMSVSEYGTLSLPDQDLDKVRSELMGRVVGDAEILDSVGFDGMLIENYDFGYVALTDEEVGSGLRIPYNSHLSVNRLVEDSVRAVKSVTNKPIGINLLTNDPLSTFDLAQRTNCQFVQIDSITGKYEGRMDYPVNFIKGLRRDYPGLFVLGGLHPKYYEREGTPDSELEREQWLEKDLLELIDITTINDLLDAIVLTGDRTGGNPPKNLKFAREMRPHLQYFAGSGVKKENVAEQLEYANGLIVGSALKEGGVERDTGVSYGLAKDFMDF
jgi:uncharacterized protein